MVLTAVIADDERSIVDLIERLLSGTDVTIAGRAYSGNEAFSIVCEKKPDILIADIRMPGINGIELIAKVKGEFPDVEVIIISGYRDFEYAHSALKLGANEYLLKPIKKAELQAAVTNIQNKKHGKTKAEQKIKKMEQRLEQSIQALRSDFILNNVVKGAEGAPGREIDANEIFRFAGEHYCAAILKGDVKDWAQMDIAQARVIVKSACEKALLTLKQFCEDADYVCRDTCGYFLMNYQSGISDEKGAFLKTGEQLKSMLDMESYKYEFLKFTMAFGREADTLAGIGQSCRTAKRALENRVNQDAAGIMLFDKLEKTLSPRPESWMNADERARLGQAVGLLNSVQANEVIAEIVERCSSAQDRSFIFPLCEEILSAVCETVAAMKQLDQDGAPDEEEMRQKLRNSAEFAVIVAQLQDIVGSTLDYHLRQQNNKDNKPIRIIKQYVEEHYASPIQLEDVAKLVFLSPVYVSSAFKTQSGISFTSYVIQTRIEKAKELLRHTLLNISEIAQAVGYSDVKHFSKLFKKHVGIKPIEYRKFYA